MNGSSSPKFTVLDLAGKEDLTWLWDPLNEEEILQMEEYMASRRKLDSTYRRIKHLEHFRKTKRPPR